MILVMGRRSGSRNTKSHRAQSRNTMRTRLPAASGITAVRQMFGAVSNQYAAMPSLHLAWALWCAIVILPVLHRRGARALVCTPTYQLPAIASRIAGAEVEAIPPLPGDGLRLLRNRGGLLGGGRLDRGRLAVR